MCAKWAEPTRKTIKVPSIQTILLMLILAGALAAIIWISIAAQLELPKPTAPPTSRSSEGPAAWISAVGQAIGAIGTAGALWLGSVTFHRQVTEQQRRQATAVSMSTFPVKDGPRKRVIRLQLRNASELPIYGVSLVGTNRIGEYKDQNFRHALPAGEHFSVDLTSEYGVGGYAMFTDSAGNSWKRYMNGDFEPHGKKPGRWSRPGSKKPQMGRAR